MKHKNILALLIIGFISIQFVSGQVIVDATGEVLKATRDFNLDGSPFILKSWAKGEVKFNNGKTLKNMVLNYDEIQDAAIFKGDDGKALYFTEEINEFNLNNRIFRSGFNPFKNFTISSFYEVLVDGNVKLLKKNVKTISEVKEYSATTTKKVINENIGYYISKQNEIVQLKKKDLKTLIENLGPDKSTALIDYSNNNNINFKNEDDFKKIVAFYNSLQ